MPLVFHGYIQIMVEVRLYNVNVPSGLNLYLVVVLVFGFALWPFH